MRRDDASYFSRRAIEEQVAARHAVCAAARERHEELAVMYRFRSAMLKQQPDCWDDSRAQMTVEAV